MGYLLQDLKRRRNYFDVGGRDFKVFYWFFKV